MAPVVLTALYLNINSNDLTLNVRKAELPLEGAAVDATAMGGNGWNINLMGLKSGSLSIEVIDDFAAGLIDQILWNAFAAGVQVPFEIRPTNAAVGVNNPKVTGNILPNKYFIGGTLGELAMKSLEYPTTGAVARATS